MHVLAFPICNYDSFSITLNILYNKNKTFALKLFLALFIDITWIYRWTLEKGTNLLHVRFTCSNFIFSTTYLLSFFAVIPDHLFFLIYREIQSSTK